MRRVFAQANIAYDQQIGHLALDGSYRPLHDPIIGPRAGCDFVFLFRQPEKDYGRNA
jgi:hypothetical protein